MARTSEPGLTRRVAGSSPSSARYLFQLSAQVTNGAIETSTKVERARSKLRNIKQTYRITESAVAEHWMCHGDLTETRHSFLLRAPVLFMTS